MCGIDPVSAGLGIAKTVVGFGAASADYKAKAAQWKQNYVNSLSAGRDEQEQNSLRMIEEGTSITQKRHLTNVEHAEAVASAEASAASSGVGGVSLDNIKTGIAIKVREKRDADEFNFRSKVQQLQVRQEATNTTIVNRINSAERPQAPSPLGYALQGIGGTLGSAA